VPENWRHWEGQVVDGRFPLHQYLGSSEHSAVFLTGPWQGADRAAIKLICTRPQQREAQLRSLYIATKLAHPNLLRVYHTGECELEGSKLLYAVSEYADENLAQILPSRPLTPAECSDLLPPLLEVLSYVHSQSLVFSDLQPSNIMAIGDQVKLPSDGLRAAGESSCGVKPNAYFSPEIVSGEPWTPACDVWSLGVTLVEVLTQRPVSGGSYALTALPSPFREIAQHCLVRDPGRRWTVPEIVAHLRPEPVAPEPQTVPPPREIPKKKKTAVAIVAACLVLVVLIGALLLNRHSNTNKGAKAPEQTPATTEGARSLPPSPVLPSDSPGAVAEKSLPEVPRSASNTIHGQVKVQVKVSVDGSGKVVGSRLLSAGPSKFFAALALRAAPGWRFVPPRKDGQNVASQWMLKYEFGRTGTSVQPTQITP